MVTDNLTFAMIETNGVSLHVAQAGPTDGELVILLHGFPEFWYGWKAQIPYLVAQGYRVWAPDQRGYNLSEKPSGIEAYRLDTLAHDIIGLIDQSGRDKVYLVGHDWGAAVAWSVALIAPEKLHRLVILNVPHPSVMLDTIRTNVEQMLRSWYIGFFQLPLLPEALLTFGDGSFAAQALQSTSRPGTFTDDDIARYTRAWQQPGAMTAMLNWYRAMVRTRIELPTDIRVHVPTLVIWGVKDTALSKDMAQPSIDLVDDGRLVFIDEASHWVQHEEPERVNALIGEFFSSPGSTTATTPMPSTPRTTPADSNGDASSETPPDDGTAFVDGDPTGED